jgi:succinate dehydrogenase/fumarate reductase iron-sulfur protein
MQVSVYRYDPDKDSAPYMQDFDVELPQGKDIMVLELLTILKEQDETVTFRRSCREGVCGSDGMSMNGKNGLACMTPVSKVAKGGKLQVKPLPGLPVIRDLVVDMEQFYAQYRKISPFLINNEARSVCNRQKIALSSTGCTNAFCVRVAHHRVLRFGGTLTSSLAQPVCCRPIASSLTVATRLPKNASVIWRILSACFVAGAS